MRTAWMPQVHAVAMAASLAAASPAATGTGVAPSRLDYVLIASLADANSLMAMTAYRPTTQDCNVP